MSNGIQMRGPDQFRVQIRRKGRYQTRTFRTLREAQDWQRIVEGKITGDEFVDLKLARQVTLAEACAWMINGRHFGTNANAKNIVAKLRYWAQSPLAHWSIAAIHDWDLIQWRREVLDSDNASRGKCVGPGASCGAQTAIHRLNVLAKLMMTWSRANQVPLENPVKPGVRPPKPDGRERRISRQEEERLIAAAATSSRPWLVQAIIIALETALRQGELAGLEWRKVNLGGPRPYVDVPRTKNERPRRVPLSRRAVTAFQELLGMRRNDAPDARILPVATARGIIHAFRDVADMGEFDDLRWHDLRHEAISRLFELTDLRDNEIMSISGHLTPSMLTRYTHLRTDWLAERLPGGRLNTREVNA